MSHTLRKTGSICILAVGISMAVPSILAPSVHAENVRAAGLSSKPLPGLPPLGRPGATIKNSFENQFERLVLRRLRRNLDNDRRSAGSVVVNGGDSPSVTIVRNDNALTGQLMEYRRRGSLNPRSLVIRVPEQLKKLGEERAERREARYAAENDQREFHFYRDNEAYDPRFPSIVFLKAPD